MQKYKSAEAKEGEFSLVYNSKDTQHPVALTREQHDRLQVLLKAIDGPIHVIIVVEMKPVRSAER